MSSIRLNGAAFVMSMVAIGTMASFAASGSAVTAASVEETLKLESVAFFEATHRLLSGHRQGHGALSRSDLWSVMDRFGAERLASEPSTQSIVDHDYLVQTLGVLGDDSDQRKLLGIFRTLPPTSPYLRGFLRPLGEYRIRQQLRTLEQAGKRIELDLTEPEVPARLRGASEELQVAWQTYMAAVAAFDSKMDRLPEADRISVQDNWGLFYKKIGDGWEGEGKGFAREEPNMVGGFFWGFWCGTHSSALYEPQHRALFSELLQGGQMEAALGAMFRLAEVETNSWLFEFNKLSMADDSWQRRFAELCGIDWEHLWAGALLNGQRFAAPAMARHGTARSAWLLLAMSSLPGIVERRDYLLAIAAFVEPSDAAAQFFWLEPRVDREIPADLQRQLLEVLHQRVRPGVESSVLETVVGQLASLGRPESREALRRATQSPLDGPRSTARAALLALGENLEP